MSPAGFVSSFGGRIEALAQAHDLLTQGSLDGAELARLVRDQVMLGASAFVTGYGHDAFPDAFREGIVLSKAFSRDGLIAVVALLVGGSRT